MISLFTDVYYETGVARAGCVLVKDCIGGDVIEQFSLDREIDGDYVPGEFYRREMPILCDCIDQLASKLDCIVVDGYVWLASERPGLGAHLFDHYQGRYMVIGIAKKQFQGNDLAIEVLRGKSERPLYVTSQGIEPGEAAALVGQMEGTYRIPAMHKLADSLSRG